jgi:excisionase family DNA binding protein
VAGKLRIHERTVRRLLADGKLPGQRIGAKKWRISGDALKAYMEGGQVPAPGKREEGKEPEGKVMAEDTFMQARKDWLKRLAATNTTFSRFQPNSKK